MSGDRGPGGGEQGGSGQSGDSPRSRKARDLGHPAGDGTNTLNIQFLRRCRSALFPEPSTPGFANTLQTIAGPGNVKPVAPVRGLSW
jgi:hypothetical protein